MKTAYFRAALIRKGRSTGTHGIVFSHGSIVPAIEFGECPWPALLDNHGTAPIAVIGIARHHAADYRIQLDHRALMFLVNQRLKVLPDDVASPGHFSSLPPQVRLKARDAFLGHTDLIQAFVNENPAHFSQDELDIVRSWRDLVHGKIYHIAIGTICGRRFSFIAAASICTRH